ncbi:hypothetical protein [Kutzneria buriramensis]|uniref:Uncharacterized protein n=1 Tax=Kutzneria buriramensis TaxID=1045776 RepID=A0A3E0HZC8_9PSEU|nr:hypothetical protein [Kutzneria buriramensis]REH51809.1 hypothetical protein BCF44_103258 [Kutzneria buriramensis]
MDTTDVDEAGGRNEESAHKSQLAQRVRARRVEIDAFLDRARPRNSRLAVTSVVSSALAAVLTGAPAVGGDELAGAAQKMLGLGQESAIWRTLCLLALAASVIAGVCTNLTRSQNTAARIGIAETANAELDNLETQLELGQLRLDAALKLYQQSTAKVTFIDEDLAPRR